MPDRTRTQVDLRLADGRHRFLAVAAPRQPSRATHNVDRDGGPRTWRAQCVAGARCACQRAVAVDRVTLCVPGRPEHERALRPGKGRAFASRSRAASSHTETRRVACGGYGGVVGRSSRDLQRHGTLAVGGARCKRPLALDELR